MKKQTLLFLLGILLLQNFSTLPDLYWVGIILFIALFCKLLFKTNYITAFLCGFAWVIFYANFQVNWKIPNELEGKTIQVSGYIASLPAYDEHHKVTFLFYIKKIITSNQKINVNHLVKLSWMKYENDLMVGDEWLLTVRLKRIHSTMNPGGFDYEAWAFQENIHGTGYVISKTENIKISSHWYHYSLNRIRQYFQHKIELNLKKTNTSAWIEALIIGERQNISQESWDILRNTGTNHLMAIAGLHIGFMAGFTHFLFSFFWKKNANLSLLFPAQQAGAISALIVALIYSALAGFSIPTQRACIMLSVYLLMVLLRRKLIPWQGWSIALLIVMLLNPLDVLTESFWLSFGSVALIIYGMSGRLKVNNIWWKWGRIQWVIAIGLIPFSLWLFHQFSWVGFIANSIAIPCVGFIIVPICLLGAMSLVLSDKLGGFFLSVADYILSMVWNILSYLSHLSWSSWFQFIPNHYVLICSCIGMILLLAPSGFPGRFLGLIWMLPLILYKPLLPKAEEVVITLLDVGQGLSAIVQTQNHILVYDAGPRLSQSFDMGESVVTPFLYTLNVKKIDKLVISHGDNDHIGGSDALLKNFKVLSIQTSVPEKFLKFPAQYCLRNDSWSWDKVEFKFLYPVKENLDLDNDSSCVLHIQTGKQSILLPGDIEKKAEKYLTENSSDELASTILIAPHHGSKTSGKETFVRAVHPAYVLYSTGYRNRYHFPNPGVMQEYSDLNAKQFDTVKSGAIKIKLSPLGVEEISEYRVNHKRYWNNE